MEPSTAVEGLVPLTLDRAKELAAEAVAERGSDYVYSKPEDISDMEADCLYVHGSGPGCLVGHVLHKHGVSLEELEGQEGWTARDLPAEWIAPEARSYLAIAQLHQDGGASWGKAVAHANEAVSA